MSDWHNEKYEQVFDDTLLNLQRRKELDSSFTLEELEKLLGYQYVRQEHDWEGRGIAFEITQQATVDAYERMIHDWRKELSENKEKGE